MLTTLFFGGGGGTVLPNAIDLAEAVAELVLADAGLAADFGRDDWFWVAEAPPSDPLPRAVWTDVGQTIDEELLEDRPDRSVVLAGSAQLAVYASGRTVARTLGRAVAVAIESASAAGTIVYQESTLIDVSRSGVEQTTRDPERGPSGEAVFQHLIVFSYLAAEG